jgi:hypothetical protein
MDDVVTEPKPAQAATITGPRIVTARNPRRGRFSDTPDMTPEEHERRGDAAEALFANWCAACARNDATRATVPLLHRLSA